MLKKLLIYTLLCFQLFSFAQQDAWVYLKDKENTQNLINNPITILTQKALDRKAKHNIVIDARDVPVNESYITALKNATGITVMAKSKWLNAVHIRGSQTNINNLLTNPATAFIDRVDFADKSLNTNKTHKTKASLKSKDKFAFENVSFKLTYGNSKNQIEMIHTDALHSANYTGEGVTIAVLDGGFANVYNMSAFKRLRDSGNLKGGYDFVNRSNNIYANTVNKHGTLVLSAMAGYVENAYVGTAPDATYYLFITEDSVDENPVEESYWVEAAERADSLGVDIINTSLGYKDYVPNYPNYSYTSAEMNGNTAFITRGANIAFQKGLLLITSAGNEAGQGISAPADSKFVLTIGAVNPAGNYASFSSLGSSFQPSRKPDVVAQGQDTALINSDGTFGTANGTSFSTPIIAGSIACLMQALPNKTNAEIMQLVRESSSQYNSPDFQLGYGIPNFKEALDAVILDVKVSDNNVAGNITFLVYPNPTKDFIYFKIPSAENNFTVTFFSVLGQQVMECSVSKVSNKIDVSSLSNGIYIVKTEFKNETKSFNLIKY